MAAAVRRRSFDLPGGSVKTGGGEILLRTKGQAYRGADFEGILLRSRRDGTRLWLRDAAQVVDGFAETDTEGLFDGKPSVLVQVFRVGDQNALEISKTVHEFVSEKKARLSCMPTNGNSFLMARRNNRLPLIFDCETVLGRSSRDFLRIRQIELPFRCATMNADPV